MAPSNKLQEGSRKGPSFLFVLVPLGIVLLLVIGFITLQSTDPITGYIGQRCPTDSCSTSLVPEVFSVGEGGLAAGRRLLEAGYFENGGSGGDVDFMKRGQPPYRLICHTNYHVTLSLDVDGNLSDAKAATSATCV